ncbi:MAG: Ig-like domain-containing protein, partial [Pseudomonadota bacterium]|nr:Ig-like domain-containing protein [Pseudomonadota bacterium]
MNDAPNLTSSSFIGLEDTDIDGQFDASDADGDPLTYDLITAPIHGQVVLEPEPGVDFSYRPDHNFSGRDVFVVVARDPQGAESEPRTMSIEIDAVNDPPELTELLFETPEDTALTAQLRGSDDGRIAAYVIVRLPSHGQFILNDAQTGDFTYIPTENFFGRDHIDIMAIDDGGLRSEVVRVTIDVAPTPDPLVFVAPTPQAAIRVDRRSGDIRFTIRAADPDGSAIRYAVDELPNGAQINEQTGDFIWPVAHQVVGVHTMVLIAESDGDRIDRRLDLEVRWVLVDSDGDGLDDDVEDELGLDPTNPDTDGDTIDDDTEVDEVDDPSDVDGDGTID